MQLRASYGQAAAVVPRLVCPGRRPYRPGIALHLRPAGERSRLAGRWAPWRTEKIWA